MQINTSDCDSLDYAETVANQEEVKMCQTDETKEELKEVLNKENGSFAST